MNSTDCFFTWNYKQIGDHSVFSKLDLDMVNEHWNLNYPSYVAHFMHAGMFDHSPIVINIYPSRDVGKRLLKYITMWSTATAFVLNIAQC